MTGHVTSMGEESVQRFDRKTRRQEPIRKNKRQMDGKHYTESWKNRLKRYGLDSSGSRQGSQI
jgi:hypothetical protein